MARTVIPKVPRPSRPATAQKAAHGKPRFSLVSPAAQGWRINDPGAVNGSGLRKVGTLAEAAAAVSADQEIHLALPSDAGLLARWKFPATDRAELDGMVRLQLEKTLPYPAEQIASDFDIVESTGRESVLLASAVSTARLETICQPLRAADRLPTKVTLFVMHVAATCPKNEIVFLVYKEEGKLIAALCEKAQPVCVRAMPGVEALCDALPQFLMAAELEGVPTNVSLVRLDKACAELETPLAEAFGVRVELFSPDSPTPPAPRADLLPAAWQRERQRLTRTASVKKRLLQAGAVYAALLLLAGLALLLMQWRAHSLQAKLDALTPQLDYVRARQTRWNALAPAFDPASFAVELLYQVNASLPADSLRITSFRVIDAGATLSIECEAPTPALAIKFGEMLKANPALSRYTFDIGTPRNLPNEHAQIEITGKSS